MLANFSATTLTGIYFGAKMPEDQMQMIATLLNGTNTKLYRMRIEKGRFALQAESY